MEPGTQTYRSQLYGDHDATIVLMFLQMRAYVCIRTRAPSYAHSSGHRLKD